MGQERHQQASGSPGTEPLIITCAITGDHQKSEHPDQPVTLDEQVAAARDAVVAGAAIIHIHGRRQDNPRLASVDPDRYREINEAIRAACPDVLIDNTQMAVPLGERTRLAGRLFQYTSANLAARPDIMSLNPGPMTFRGGNGSSSALITTFDETERMALELREAGIKPQVFLYHPGHLDILHHLIERGALASPYWVQLVFGQQVGNPATVDAFSFMTRNLPAGCLYQTCALGRDAIRLNLFAMVEGGHVRTGMEDALEFTPGVPVRGNGQLVERIARFAADLGRSVAMPREARTLLGMA